MEIAGESFGMDCDKTIHRYLRDHWRHLFPNNLLFATSGQSLEEQAENSRISTRTPFAEWQSSQYRRWISDAGLRFQKSPFGQAVQGGRNLWVLCCKGAGLLRFEGAFADRFERDYR